MNFKLLLFVILLSTLCAGSMLAQGSARLIEAFGDDDAKRHFSKLSFETQADLEDKLKSWVIHRQSEGFLAYSLDSLQIDSGQVRVYFYAGQSYELEVSGRSGRREMNNMQDNGQPFAQLLTTRQLDSLKVQSATTIDAGPTIYMDSLVLLGGASFSQRVIESHIAWKKGAVYAERKLEIIDKRLRKLTGVQLLKSSSVIFAQDKARVYITLGKRKANRIDGIVGLQPDAAGDVQFTGQFDLDLHNALNHLDRVRVSWKRIADATQELDLGLRYPYLFKSPVGIDLSLEQFRQDSTFNEVKLKAGLFFEVDGGGTLEALVRSQSVNDLRSESTETDRVSTSTVQYGLNYSLQLLDDLYNPLRGGEGAIEMAYGPKALASANSEGTGEVQQWILTLATRYFKQISKSTTLMLGVSGQHTNSEVILAKELYRFGGLRSLRGQDEQSVRASSYAIGTLEYRLLTAELSYISVFYDHALYEGRYESVLERDDPYGFGVGATLDTGSGVLSINYALGSRFGAPVDLSTGKIHLGYTAVF